MRYINSCSAYSTCTQGGAPRTPLNFYYNKIKFYTSTGCCNNNNRFERNDPLCAQLFTSQHQLAQIAAVFCIACIHSCLYIELLFNLSPLLN